jgi:hypothetical protein
MNIRIAATILALAGISLAGWSQDSKAKKTGRPDLPGNFMIDLGLNRALDRPEHFNQGLWGSRTVNLYYQYPIRLGKSKFSFNPGAGLSMERWRFTNGFTLRDTIELDGGLPAETQVEQFNLVRGSTILGVPARKSMLITNYFEIPVEFRFDTRPEDPARSFNVAIGGRIGVLIDSSTKLRYEKEEEMRVLQDKQNFGLNPIRYGAYLRFGIGGFTWFFMYNLSETFAPGRGPAGTTMNSFTAGISVNGF